MKDEGNKKKVKAYFGSFKYEGYLEDQDDTHFYIFDLRSQKIIRLPKAMTSLEDVE